MRRLSKKIIIVAGFLLILTAALYATIGYVPFVGTFLAERRMNQYMELQGYPPVTGNVHFDGVCYGGYVLLEDGNMLLNCDLRTDWITDYKRNDDESELSSDYERVKAAMPDNLIMPKIVHGFAVYSIKDPEVKMQRLYLLSVYNSADIVPEESGKQAAEITMKVIELLGDSYYFTGVQTVYYDRNGGYTIEIGTDSMELLTYQKLYRETRPLEEKELGEEYQVWRTKLTTSL